MHSNDWCAYRTAHRSPRHSYASADCVANMKTYVFAGAGEVSAALNKIA